MKDFMKKICLFSWLQLIGFLSSSFLFAEPGFDLLVKKTKEMIPKIKSISASGDEKKRNDALVKALEEFGLENPSDKTSTVSQKQNSVKPSKPQSKTEEDDEDDLSASDLTLPSENPVEEDAPDASTSVPSKSVAAAKVEPEKPAARASEVVKPATQKQQIGVDLGGLSIVKAYLDAKDAYDIADKNNPLIISPFAGAADKAARKVYEDAKKALEAPKKAYLVWLSKVTTNNSDFIQLKEKITKSVADCTTVLEKAKKENPMIATSDKDKQKRAQYQKATFMLANRKAVLKDMGKK